MFLVQELLPLTCCMFDCKVLSGMGTTPCFLGHYQFHLTKYQDCFYLLYYFLTIKTLKKVYSFSIIHSGNWSGMKYFQLSQMNNLGPCNPDFDIEEILNVRFQSLQRMHILFYHIFLLCDFYYSYWSAGNIKYISILF